MLVSFILPIILFKCLVVPPVLTIENYNCRLQTTSSKAALLVPTRKCVLIQLPPQRWCEVRVALLFEYVWENRHDAQ